MRDLTIQMWDKTQLGVSGLRASTGIDRPLRVVSCCCCRISSVLLCTAFPPACLEAFVLFITVHYKVVVPPRVSADEDVK
jgi:hypothetical protein